MIHKMIPNNELGVCFCIPLYSRDWMCDIDPPLFTPRSLLPWLPIVEVLMFSRSDAADSSSGVRRGEGVGETIGVAAQDCAPDDEDLAAAAAACRVGPRDSGGGMSRLSDRPRAGNLIEDGGEGR